jgi:hypothetical protein
MVADTKDQMSKWWETMNETFRMTMDNGRRVSESMARLMGEAWRTPWNPDDCASHTDRVARQWTPLMQKNFETAMESMDVGYRAGVGLMKTAFNATKDINKDNVQDKTRLMWDASFDALRTGAEASGKCQIAAWESMADVWHTACATEKAQKPTARESK